MMEFLVWILGAVAIAGNLILAATLLLLISWLREHGVELLKLHRRVIRLENRGLSAGIQYVPPMPYPEEVDA